MIKIHKKVNNAIKTNKKTEISSKPKGLKVLLKFNKKVIERIKIIPETIIAKFFINCVLCWLKRVKIIIEKNNKIRIKPSIKTKKWCNEKI